MIASLDPCSAGAVNRLPFDRCELEGNIVERFEKVVSALPSRIALVGGDEVWTYAELDRRSNQVAHAIRDLTAPGAGCIAYHTSFSPDMVISALAGLKAGKAFLCLHPKLPLSAQQQILADAAPELLLADAANLRGAKELAGGGLEVALLDEAVGTSNALGRAIKASDPAVIYYTSGSTGRPKGVVKPHRAVLHRAWLCAEYDGIMPGDRQSQLTSCSFASSEADLFGALLNGAQLELFDVATLGFAKLRRWIDERRITLLHPPVVLFRRYLSSLEGSGLHPSVRLLSLAGDTVVPADLEQWRKRFADTCALRHRFSSTEAGHIAVGSIGPGERPVPGVIPPARPVADKLLSIVDEQGNQVRPGESGELVVRSSYMAAGYWRRETESKDRFRTVPDQPNQYTFHTGDIVRLREQGSFEFLFRRDNQVKVRGFRIELSEIEQALLALPCVEEAAVIAERLVGANALVSFLVLRPGASLQTEDVRTALGRILPQWKIPAYIFHAESLPLTPTGKIDRQRLHQAVHEVRGGRIAFSA